MLHSFTRPLLLLGVLSLLVLPGCTDDLAGPDTGAPFDAPVVTEPSEQSLTEILAAVRAEAERSTKLRDRDALYARLDEIEKTALNADAEKLLFPLFDLELDFVLVYAPSVTDPEDEAESTFSGHRVKKRSYYRDSISGVSFSISLRGVLSLLHALLTDPAVLFVQADGVLSRPLDVGAYQTIGAQEIPWGIQNAGAPESSVAAGDGEGTVEVDLFVLDSRVAHSDLRVVSSMSFLGSRDTPDPEGHGTHVAGTAAALDNGFGVVGTAPGARIHAVEVLDRRGQVKLSTLLSAVDHVAAYRRAHPGTPIVVNMSLGGYTGTTAYNALDLAVQASIAQGIVYCVSAGNDGHNARYYSPAHVAEAITVGAFDADGGFASYSNYGPVVDVLAPGTGILSTLRGGRYGFLSGTSMATPHVAGAAAVYLSAHPDASPAEVRQALVESAHAGVTNVPSGTTPRALRMSSF